MIQFCVVSDEMTEEEKQKKQIRDKMRQEYYFSIKEEGKVLYI